MPAHPSAISSRSAAVRRRLLAFPVLILLAAPIFFYRLGRPGLGDPDEGRNAEVAREMLISGDLVTPRINEARYLDKPPAFFWTLALVYSVFGVSELSARATSALFALAGIGLTVWFARRHFGMRAAWLAGAALATTPIYIVFGRTVIFDMMLTFCMSTSAMAAFEAMRGEGPRARLAGALFFAAAGVGTLTKGPVALIAPLLVAAAWAAFERRPARLLRLGFPSGLLIYAAIVLPWLVLVSMRNPGYLRYALIGENLARMTSNRFDTARPVHFYFKVILGGLFPWILYCCAAAGRRLWSLWRTKRAGERLRPIGAAESPPLIPFAAVWFGVLFSFFSLITSKRPSYVLPCAVPIAILTGGLWSAASRRRQGIPDEEGAGTAEETARADRARQDLAAGSVWVALTCACSAVILALGGPAGLALGAGGGKYDVLLSRQVLFGMTAAAMAISGLVLFLTRKAERPLVTFTAAVLAIGVMLPLARAVSGYIDMARSSRPMSRFLAGRLTPQDSVICYDEYRPGLNFYLRRPVYLSSGPGRTFTSNYIKQNIEQFRHDPSFRMIPKEDLPRALLRDSGAFVVAPRRSFKALESSAGVPLTLIYEDFYGGVFVRSDGTARPP